MHKQENHDATFKRLGQTFDVPWNTYTNARRCDLSARIFKAIFKTPFVFLSSVGRVVIRLGSSTPFSQELNELQEEVKPLWKLRSCPRDFKRTSVERLFREARFALDWCSFRLVSFVRIETSEIRGLIDVSGRTGATESAARKRETRIEHWIGCKRFRNFRAHGVAMGQVEQSEHSREKLPRGNCHHDLCVRRSVSRVGRFAQHALVPGSRENVSIYIFLNIRKFHLFIIIKSKCNT